MYKSISSKSKHTSLNLILPKLSILFFQRKPKPYGQDENIVFLFYHTRAFLLATTQYTNLYKSQHNRSIRKTHTMFTSAYTMIFSGDTKKNKAGCKNVADENKQNPCLCSTQTFYWMKSVTHSGSPNRKRFVLHRCYIIYCVSSNYNLSSIYLN